MGPPYVENEISKIVAKKNFNSQWKILRYLKLVFCKAKINNMHLNIYVSDTKFGIVLATFWEKFTIF